MEAPRSFPRRHPNNTQVAHWSVSGVELEPAHPARHDRSRKHEVFQIFNAADAAEVLFDPCWMLVRILIPFE